MEECLGSDASPQGLYFTATGFAGSTKTSFSLSREKVNSLPESKYAQ